MEVLSVTYEVERKEKLKLPGCVFEDTDRRDEFCDKSKKKIKNKFNT